LHEAISLYMGEHEPGRVLSRLISLRLEVQPDLKSAEADEVTRPSSQRKRQAHRDDWPPPSKP
jgi:hypothetical protein